MDCRRPSPAASPGPLCPPPPHAPPGASGTTAGGHSGVPRRGRSVLRSWGLPPGPDPSFVSEGLDWAPGGGGEGGVEPSPPPSPGAAEVHRPNPRDGGGPGGGPGTVKLPLKNLAFVFAQDRP